MARGRPLDVEREVLEAFTRCGLVNEYLVSILSDDVWRMAPQSGRGRSISAIVAHSSAART